MRFAKVIAPNGTPAIALIDNDTAKLAPGVTLTEILHASDPIKALQAKVTAESGPAKNLHFLAPLDDHEVWAAGVTYKRSKVAREEESVGAAQFYDKVYTAPRPELFLKAPAWRVVNPGAAIRVRADSRWNVPEPELALVISPAMKIVGYTIGNDVSSRDIEGENPLYLPQAKVYRGACSLGPVITPASAMPALGDVGINLKIERGGIVAFEGTTTLAAMARTCESLVEWLGRELDFPNGAILLTGTGIVPPDTFSLAPGDTVTISIDGIGTLVNPVGP